MKTTLDIDDHLLAQAKSAAALQNTSLTRLVEEGLGLRLRKPQAGRRSARKSGLPVYCGKGGMAAGIDPLSNQSLYDAADS